MAYRIEELPEEDRPREKLSEKGVKSLSESELLSIVLRTGISGKNVKALSADILTNYRVSEISDVPMEKLEEFKGVSEVKAGQLKAVSELGRRMKRTEKDKIMDFCDIRDYVQDMKFDRKEMMRAIALNSSNEILECIELEGDVSSVRFETRKLMRKVVQTGAAAFIIVHNHPSGRTEPTESDMEATEELVEASEAIGVKLLDHVIVGKEVLSMRGSTGIEFH